MTLTRNTWHFGVFRKELVVAFVTILLLPTIFSSCPNDCSKRGTCTIESACECNAGYFGGDCSLGIFSILKITAASLNNYVLVFYFRIKAQCPYALAWVDKAYALNDAHNHAECANRGLCDRSSVEIFDVSSCALCWSDIYSVIGCLSMFPWL